MSRSIVHSSISIAAALAALSAAAPLAAQAYQCRVPQSVTVPKIERDGPVRTMPVDGYTLALSWAPEFCKGRETHRANAVQCSGRNGRFGLVVHGLWPEGRQSWPQWCSTMQRPNRVMVRSNLCMMPSARLQAAQWAKHGACMVRRPATYFRVTRILWDSIRKPDLDFLSRKEPLTAGDLREAFLIANPAWPRAAVGIKANARGWLEELRLCYGKDFMPAPCSRRRYGVPDRGILRIWRGL